MKVTIITSLLTEWDMNIYSCHLFIYLLQILEKSVYDFDTILISALIITFVFTYYKTNYPFFFGSLAVIVLGIYFQFVKTPDS